MGRGAGLWPHSAHKLCAMELHWPGGRETFFSLTQKGSKGLWWLQWGAQDSGGEEGHWGKEIRQRITFQGAGEKQMGSRVMRVGREASSWGCVGCRRPSPALDDRDGVTRLHPQSTWLRDIPQTTSLRRPGL